MSMVGSIPAALSAKVSLEKIMSLNLNEFKEGFKFDDSLSDEWQSIRLKDINFNYAHGKFSLNDVNLEIKRGEITFIIGKNGSGKSTLARLIAGEFHPASGGSIRRPFLARDVLAQRRRNIGLVGAELGIRQRGAGWGREWLGRDVIASAFAGTEGFAEEVTPAQWQEVKRLAERLGVVELLEQNAETLSQGQLRRLLLARATVHRPKLLILDEGLDFLDADSRERFQDLLPELIAAGTHLMVIVHRESDAPAGLTHHLHLEGGKVACGL